MIFIENIEREEGENSLRDLQVSPGCALQFTTSHDDRDWVVVGGSMNDVSDFGSLVQRVRLLSALVLYRVRVQTRCFVLCLFLFSFLH